MNSFNVYGQTSKEIGGNTPVWLGTVKPVPVGATLDGNVGDLLGGHLKAGTAGYYDPVGKTFNPHEGADGGFEDANAYLYNDIFADDLNEAQATCAIVMHHPEGLLIERVYPEITEEQIATLQAKIPGVLLVRG